MAYWRTQDFAGVRVRMVEYTPGYISDHWCNKGHVLLCLDGELETELEDGRHKCPPARVFRLGNAFITYVVRIAALQLQLVILTA